MLKLDDVDVDPATDMELEVEAELEVELDVTVADVEALLESLELPVVELAAPELTEVSVDDAAVAVLAAEELLNDAAPPEAAEAATLAAEEDAATELDGPPTAELAAALCDDDADPGAPLLALCPTDAAPLLLPAAAPVDDEALLAAEDTLLAGLAADPLELELTASLALTPPPDEAPLTPWGLPLLTFTDPPSKLAKTQRPPGSQWKPSAVAQSASSTQTELVSSVAQPWSTTRDAPIQRCHAMGHAPQRQSCWHGATARGCLHLSRGWYIRMHGVQASQGGVAPHRAAGPHPGRWG